jgi:hypothetical protein
LKTLKNEILDMIGEEVGAAVAAANMNNKGTL